MEILDTKDGSRSLPTLYHDKVGEKA